MTDIFLTPSVARLLEQVAAGPTPDTSPQGQRLALNGAMAALGHAAPAAGAAVQAMPAGASIQTFKSTEPIAGRLRIMYLHGGSFVAGGAVPHAGIAQALADASGAEVALVDYRLAPEHPLPVGRDDCIEAAEHLARSGPLVLVGDSAGGWLAVETALALAERGIKAFRRLVLVNPMIKPSNLNEGSMQEFATGFFAASIDFADAWRTAGPWAENRRQPGGADADLSGLPPTIVLTNEADPVRDEGENFAERLSAAGIPTLSLRARGLIHAAWLFPKMLPEAQLLLAIIAGAATDDKAVLTVRSSEPS